MKAQDYKTQLSEIRSRVVIDIEEEIERLTRDKGLALEVELPNKFSINNGDLANLTAEEVFIGVNGDLAIKLWNDFTGEYEYEYDDYFTTDQLIFVLEQLQNITEL